MSDVIECGAPACRHLNRVAAELCAACGHPLRPDPTAAPAAAPHAEIEPAIAPFTGTPEEIERQWFERCSGPRRHDAPAHAGARC